MTRFLWPVAGDGVGGVVFAAVALEFGSWLRSTFNTSRGTSCTLSYAFSLGGGLLLADGPSLAVAVVLSWAEVVPSAAFELLPDLGAGFSSARLGGLAFAGPAGSSATTGMRLNPGLSGGPAPVGTGGGGALVAAEWPTILLVVGFSFGGSFAMTTGGSVGSW